MIDANAMLQVQFIQRMQEMFLTFNVNVLDLPYRVYRILNH